MHVHFMQIKERVIAAPSNSLLAKVVLCTVSVVKADRVLGGGYKPYTKGDKYFCGYKWPFFGKLICYLPVGLYVWKNDTATSEN